MRPMTQSPEIPEVDPSEARTRMEAGVRHVDVREPDEVAAKRIPGGENVPLSSFLDAYESALSKEVPVIVSCRSGARSGRVTAFLVEHGYDAVNLAGGILAWEREGLPVERG